MTELETIVLEQDLPDTFWDMERWGAEYSADIRPGQKPEAASHYRYRLWRIWDETKKPAMFIGVNPSTATHLEDDPTVFRCRCDAMGWGCGGMYMMNLFPFRATNPEEMKGFYRALSKFSKKEFEATQAFNLKRLAEVAALCDPVICAWGNHGSFLEQSKAVYFHLRRAEVELKCLKIANTKEPWHRLYLEHGLQPIPYSR